MTQGARRYTWGAAKSALAAMWICVAPATAHPHVFVDGGVDFVFDRGARLEALQVTWLYDEFETLYTLSALGLDLNDQGGLDEIDRQILVKRLSDWPSDFDGSVHLSSRDGPVLLDWPTSLDAILVDGRLKITFTRSLDTPLDLDRSAIEVAFYESTYFFAFSVTYPPKLVGGGRDCATGVIPFKADPEDKALQETLAKLGREETPEDSNVGAFFADRITVSCE